MQVQVNKLLKGLGRCRWDDVVEIVCRVMMCCMVHMALVNQKPQYLDVVVDWRGFGGRDLIPTHRKIT
jgi:hypothetical protein